MRVFEQAQGLVEGATDGVNLDGPLSYGSLGCGGFALDAFLFELELIKSQSVVVVGLLGLGSLVFEPGEALALAVNFGLALGVATGEVRQDDIPERFDPVLGQSYGVPVLGHRLFDGGDWHIALRATVFVFLASQAVEVRIRRAEAVRRHGYTEPPAAASAEQAALEVVGAGLGFVLVEVAGTQDRIHGVPSSLVDERLMLAGVFDAAVRDDPQVVAVVQDAVHLLRVQGSFRHALGGGQPQPQVVGLIRELGDRVQASGVAAEAVGDDRPSGRVNHHYADVFAGDIQPLV